MSLATTHDHPTLPYGYPQLADQTVERNVFFEPQMLAPALDHLAPESVQFCVAAEPETGIALAAMPVARAQGRYGPLPTPVPLTVWHHPYSMVGTPLISTEEPDLALQKLLAKALDRCDGPPVLLMPMIRVDGPFWPLLQDILKATNRRYRVLESYQRAGLSVADPKAVTLRKLIGKKSAQSIRASRRKLQERGTLDHDAARHPADIGAALERFLALEAGGWKGRTGTALSSIGHEGFARDAVLALAETGRSRVDIMTLDGTPVAATLSICAGSEKAPLWMPWKTAYDEAHADAAPGSVALHDLTEALLTQSAEANTPFLLDSLAGPESVIANRLWRHPWSFVDVIVDLKPGGSAAFRPIIMAETARRSAYLTAKAARRAIKTRNRTLNLRP